MTLNKSTPKILSQVGTKFFLSLLLGFSLCIISCDESSVVGLDVQPSNDLLNVDYKDTTTLITKTIREDSLRTDETVITNQIVLLGKYSDPVFGEATASLYTQVALTTNITPTSFGTNPFCDSIILSLAYDPDYYGKKERKQQTLEVSKLTEAIPSGTKNSNKTLTTGITKLATFNFIPKPADSVVADGTKLKPQLRVPLNVTFGDELLTEGVNGTGLSNNAAFVNYLKGFYITTENSALAPKEGNIMKFRLAESKMTLYYRFTGKTKITNVDSTIYTKYDFGFGSLFRFTHFSHNYTSANANLTAQLSATPPTQNDVTFIQAMAGVKTKVEMPYLMNWNDSGAVSINKAELVIKIDTDPTYDLDTFAAPAALFLFSIDDVGANMILPDYLEGSNYFGGTYNASAKEYRFNVGRYIQQVLNGKYKNNGLYLLASGGSINANRVVIGGGKNTSAYKMKLNITYTKLH
ncbi:MAG: DUF4270 domain-containing protein [Bacteroidota bacterium]